MVEMSFTSYELYANLKPITPLVNDFIKGSLLHFNPRRYQALFETHVFVKASPGTIDITFQLVSNPNYNYALLVNN